VTDSPIPDRDDQTEQDRRERLERAFQARSASVELPEVFPHQELLYWLEIANMGVAGIRADELMRVYERYGSIEMLLTWSRGDLLELGARENLGLNFLDEKRVQSLIEKRERVDGEVLYDKLQIARTSFYPIVHPHYPRCLSNIHNAPIGIYTRGQMPITSLGMAIAIVGTRKPTSYGSKIAKTFAGELASAGLIVVSGMALGIDSLAHWGAIEAGGRTIAVLAGGVDHIYPSTNRKLYDRLLAKEDGLIVSEYFPGTEPKTWMFPSRNRIITGLSNALLLVEAGAKSGSLISAKFAFEQSLEVFAIPGSIWAEMSAGPNDLIHKDSARLVTSTKQILSHMQVSTARIADFAPIAVQLYGREKEVFDRLANEPTHFEQLTEALEISVGELSSALTMLELAGLIERLPGDFYQRA
jgi:DNA processing protein